VSFIGINGAGKSIIMSLLHPNSSSSRYYNIYAIQANKQGLKRIVFEKDGGNTLIEVIHEYVPKKGARHSVKSYMNKIVNNIKEELNPTGHNESFKHLVKEELHFDGDVRDICSITDKNDGLVSTSNKRRKEIVSSTIDLSQLDIMRENAISGNRTRTSSLNMFDGNLKKILMDKSSGTTFEEEINELNESINDSNDELNGKTKRLIELEGIINKIEDVSDSYIRSLTIAEKLIISTNCNTFKEVSDSYSETKHILSSKKSEIDVCNISISHIQSRLLIAQKHQLLISTRTNLQNELDAILGASTGLIMGIDNDSVENINNLFSSLLEGEKLLEALSYNINTVDFKTEIDGLSEKIDQYNEFIRNYDEKSRRANAINADYSNFNKSSKECNECLLYIDCIDSKNYIVTHQHTYNEYISVIEEYINDKRILEKLSYLNSDNKLINDINNTFTKDYITRHGLSMFTGREYLVSLRDKCTENISRHNRIVQELANIDTQIELLDDTNTEELENEISSLRNKIDFTKKEIVDLCSYLSKIDNILSIYSINISELDSSIYGMSLKDIQNEIHIHTNDEVKKHIREKKSLENDISSINNKKTILSNMLADLVYKMKSVDSLTKSIKNLSDERDVLLKCKDILTNVIPVVLLKSTMTFMENTVNKIFADNNINLAIDIEVDEENNIMIPVYTAKGKTPDVSTASAGEKCLISLLLNASLLHIMDYSIYCIDEVDGPLDEINQDLFGSILESITDSLNIEQIFIVSHKRANKKTSDRKYLIGNASGLSNIDDTVTRLTGGE